MQGRMGGGGTTVNVGVAVGGGQENLQVAISVLQAHGQRSLVLIL